MKIVFVFFVASSFKLSLEFRNIVVTTALAAFHVLILVVSKDLGAALIIFVVYLVMLYVATRQPLYILAGLGAGSAASVVAYYLFNHVRVRVLAWNGAFPGGSGDHPGSGVRLYLLRYRGRDGADLCPLHDPGMCQLLCDVP